MSEPRVWVLLGDKTGDNNQLLALADALGWPVETKPLTYTLLRAIPPRWLGPSRLSLTRSSRRLLAPPWPDIVLGIGRRSTPAMLWIARQNPATRLVLFGHPRIDPSRFDLVITTRQYPVPPRANVVTLAMPLGRKPDAVPTAAEQAFLDTVQRPLLLLAIGGPTKYWRLDPSSVAAALTELTARADRMGGTIIAVGSRRTPKRVARAIAQSLDATRHRWLTGREPRFATLMAAADEVHVTADSMSMLSEAIQTGKPVGMIPISLSPSGALRLGRDGPRGPERGRRDLRRMWEMWRRDGLVGSVGEPKAGMLSADPLMQATAAVRALLAR